MLSEILGEQGWNTYIVGKWHLTRTDEMNLASTEAELADRPRVRAVLRVPGAETNQWYPDLVYDNHPVDQPQPPEEGYHLTDDLTDKALEFIKDAKAIAPDKPFFLYYAPGACARAAPRAAGVDRAVRGRFDGGTRRSGSRRWPGRRRWASCRTDTQLPQLNPIGTPVTAPGRTARRSRGGLHQAVGHSVRRRKAPVRPDGGGVCGVPVARRPPHRAAA